MFALVIPHFPHGNGLSDEYICGKTKGNKIQYLAMEKLEMTLSEYLADCGGKMSKGDAYCTAARSVLDSLPFRDRFKSLNLYTANTSYSMILNPTTSCCEELKLVTSLSF